jgi:acetamidase/formamidase
MDYNRIREGTTLLLPVFELGALLFIGDGHAAQGDGELTGNALETSLDVEFSVDVVRGSSRMPRAEDDDHLMAMGITRSLMESFQSATEEMALWLADRYGLSHSEAALVMGTVVQFDIAEAVGRNFNVVARVPKAALASLPQKPR